MGGQSSPSISNPEPEAAGGGGRPLASAAPTTADAAAAGGGAGRCAGGALDAEGGAVRFMPARAAPAAAGSIMVANVL